MEPDPAPERIPDGLFDTTFFIDLLRGDSGARELRELVRQGDLQGYYSTMSVVELFRSNLSTPAEQHFFDGLFSRLEEVQVSREIARFAGWSLKDFNPEQARRLTVDAVIGCSALVLNVPVYTRNVEDMQHFAAVVRRY